MNNVLIFSGINDFHAVELAHENINAGNDVTFIQCDKALGVCLRNRFGNPLICHHCKNAMGRAIRKLDLHKKVKYYYLSELINGEDKREADSFRADFNSVSELKNLNYKGIEVGYGAFSSYVTFTRNVMPDMSLAFKKYISYLVKKEVMMSHMLGRLQNEYHFDAVVLHNGRFAQFKPFLGFARQQGLQFICTEQQIGGDKILKDYFYNDTPHSVSYVADKILKNWDIGNIEDREAIGRDFFERRRKGISAGDKVYTKDQKAGYLPDEWNDNVENIAIFNSSEDEFLAISKEYDGYLLFPNQYIALQTIFEHYKNDKSKHFYLRIHPNLKSVPFKSHLALLKFHYDNVTIIPADSSISSYAIMDKCEKVIIFNSTMGVEATYAEKPVIALSKYFYTVLDMVYTPGTQEEVWNLIDTKNLPSKNNENVIKYGYWMLRQNYPEVTIAPYQHVIISPFGHQIEDYTMMTVCGSFKLNVLLESILNKVNLFSKFKELPCMEPYQG